METKSFFERQLSEALITLGIATSMAVTVWAMQNIEERGLSVCLRLLVVKSVQEGAAETIIMFQSGEKARLSRKYKDYPHYRKLARESLESQHPVGVRVDSAGEIGEIARADNDFVAFVAEVSEDKVRVIFRGHDGIAHLERQHPRCQTIERELHRALKEKKRIWFVWKAPRLTLEDVKIVE